MFRYLFLLFFLVPLLEVWILVQVGSLVGAPVLIGSIILTAALGVFFLRLQGLATLFKAQAALASGQLPAVEIFEGALLLVAGALLLTPGFATDAAGFLLLWPLARRVFAQTVLRRYGLRSAADAVDEPAEVEPRRATRSARGPRNQHGRTSGEVIEGEYTRED